LSVHVATSRNSKTFGSSIICSSSLYNLLHRLGRWRRSRIPLDETFGLASEQLRLYLITCLAAVHYEAVDASARMSDVTGAP